ncbi:unnamed protein product [Caenorhabditis sp. 36 PRJEB53466]|nr:unnamed protein product [Caenorhabditis sp. 36 PRJEB53466]
MLGKDVVARAPGGPRKRELIHEQSPQPSKRNCVEASVTATTAGRGNLDRKFKFKKRKLQEVLDELVIRVENNDRQLTNNLIRELDYEHVRVVPEADFDESCTIMMKACIAAKVETVANKTLKCLMGLFVRGSVQNRRNFVLKMAEESMCEALFSKMHLDSGVLLIYTMVLNSRQVCAEDIPQKVKMTARRSLGHSAISSTSNRTAAIDFMVALAVSDTSDEKKRKDCEKILCRQAHDRDYRVRKSASEGLLRLGLAGTMLAKSTYTASKKFMNDCDSDVRITAIRLLIYYANRKAKETVGGKGTKPMSDDAFSAICDAMNDIEIAVRAEAAKTLGDFETVSEDLIFQTLDKKMMRSNANAQVVKVEQSLFALSKKASAHNDRRWKFAKRAYKPEESKSGGWSRGKELHSAAPDVPKEPEKPEEEEESIIPHGACGAFVSALEDEFMEVRKAAVYSLGRLACTRPTFAVSALEYLADMFNDEIAAVRLDAINALTPLIAHGQLNSEQLNVILKCLDDAMPESRQAMRELLKRAQFVDVSCIELCVRALLACLKRFPKDKEQVYSCMAEIGRNHAIQVQSIMRSLLDIHLVFHTREPSIEDQEYVGKLIMVLNAAAVQPSMTYVLPEFVHRHYRYLRASFPKLVRAIQVIDEQQQSGKVQRNEERTNEKAEEIVLKTYTRLCESSAPTLFSDRNLKRNDIFHDTQAISAYNESVSGAARLIFCLGEIESCIDNATHSVLRCGEVINLKQLIVQNNEDMQSIEHQFSGISDAIHSYLIHCRMYLSFLEMLMWLMQVLAPQEEIIATAEKIMNSARLLLPNDREVSPSLSDFFAACQSIFYPLQIVENAEDKRKIITPGSLAEMLNKSAPVLPQKLPPVTSLRLKYAKITYPHKDTAVEQTLRFFATLPHGIAVEFNLYNMSVEDAGAVRIKTVMPDGKFDLMRPRKEEIRKEDDYLTVSTQSKITCFSSWADAAEVDIFIGILTESGLFVPLFASPLCYTPSHIRVRIHPHSR